MQCRHRKAEKTGPRLDECWEGCMSIPHYKMLSNVEILGSEFGNPVIIFSSTTATNYFLLPSQHLPSTFSVITKRFIHRIIQILRHSNYFRSSNEPWNRFEHDGSSYTPWICQKVRVMYKNKHSSHFYLKTSSKILR